MAMRHNAMCRGVSTPSGRELGWGYKVIYQPHFSCLLSLFFVDESELVDLNLNFELELNYRQLKPFLDCNLLERKTTTNLTTQNKHEHKQ